MTERTAARSMKRGIVLLLVLAVDLALVATYQTLETDMGQPLTAPSPPPMR